MEYRKHVVLSTAHLPQSLAEKWNDLNAEERCLEGVGLVPYGYQLRLANLWPFVIEGTRQRIIAQVPSDVGYVVFDQDGPVMKETLRVFEWD